MTPKERIEKEANKAGLRDEGYSDPDPKFIKGYIAGATAEHDKAWNEAIEVCQKEFAKWLTDPLELGSVLMKKLDSLKK